MGMIDNVLSEMGFEEREAKIYLLLIKEGDMPALKIARKTGIDRTTTYDILERLIGKGFVSTYSKNKSKHFKPLKPNKLLDYFKEKYSSLQKIIPEMNKLSNKTQEKTSCEIFQGKDGLKTALNDLIKYGKDYKVINIRNEYEQILGFFNESGVLKLNEFKAKEKAIVEKGVKFKKLQKGEYRYVKNKLKSPITTLIYENVVVFFIWNEPYFAIRIENKSFSDAQEEYFDLLWKISEK